MMTWAELKEKLEKAGVLDTDKIVYIDICGGARICIHRDRDKKSPDIYLLEIFS